MKYELLKRTAIALFVGSVISTYSVAEGSKISTKSSLEDIASAINKNDENISKIKTDVSDLAKSLKGDDQNPGLLDALEEANKGINENKAALDKKADKEDVNKIKQNVSDLAKSLKGDDQNPGLLDSLEEANKGINENKEALALKADKATVDVELAKKANQADVETNKAEIAKFGAQTNSNAALLLTMAGKVDQNKKDTDEAIAKNASRITDTRNKQVLQNARLDNHGERIEANEAAIGELAKATDESVTNLGNAVNELDENLAGTQDAVAENRKDIDANAVAIDKLKETQTYKDLSKVETLVKDKASKAEVEKNASRITDTRNKQVLQNARLDNHGERIEANEAAIGELAKATDKAVTNLGDTVRDLDADLAGTQDAVAENRKDIDKNASRITDTRNKQVLQNARLDNHSERITAAEVALDTKADKTELAAKADKTELANKADKNSVYSKSETDNKFALKADNSVVRAQATDINKLRTDVNAHTKRLDHLDNRVNKLDKDLKRGLAAQAALTGLFQPYTVGKANFTAAVGGYKSQTAVAIGTGYRYTQNIATKAGVAFTQGGGVTYNAGVNFEW